MKYQLLCYIELEVEIKRCHQSVSISNIYDGSVICSAHVQRGAITVLRKVFFFSHCCIHLMALVKGLFSLLFIMLFFSPTQHKDCEHQDCSGSCAVSQLQNVLV